MLNVLKQASAAVSLLNPREVRNRARRPVNIGLVAADGASYGEMEDFLLPAGMPHQSRIELMERVHRAGDADVPETVELVLYQSGLAHGEDAYTFHGENPRDTIARILDDHDDLALALACQFPVFRKPVVERVIQSVSRENAMFSIVSALPDVIPSVIEMPWAIGEFASDTAFLTANQIRMAFQIAAACGREAGFAAQSGEVLSIVAGAFGWRALARELVGKIPLGGGLIPKGAIAYAGTFLVGRGLEYYYHANRHYTRQEREEVYRHGLDRGREVAQSLGADPRSRSAAKST